MAIFDQVVIHRSANTQSHKAGNFKRIEDLDKGTKIGGRHLPGLCSIYQVAGSCCYV